MSGFGKCEWKMVMMNRPIGIIKRLTNYSIGIIRDLITYSVNKGLDLLVSLYELFAHNLHF